MYDMEQLGWGIELHISSFIQSNSLLKLQSYITSILYSEENDDYVLTISGYKVSSLVNNIYNHSQGNLRYLYILYIHMLNRYTLYNCQDNKHYLHRYYYSI